MIKVEKIIMNIEMREEWGEGRMSPKYPIPESTQCVPCSRKKIVKFVYESQNRSRSAQAKDKSALRPKFKCVYISWPLFIRSNPPLVRALEIWFPRTEQLFRAPRTKQSLIRPRTLSSFRPILPSQPSSYRRHPNSSWSWRSRVGPVMN